MASRYAREIASRAGEGYESSARCGNGGTVICASDRTTAQTPIADCGLRNADLFSIRILNKSAIRNPHSAMTNVRSYTEYLTEPAAPRTRRWSEPSRPQCP